MKKKAIDMGTPSLDEKDWIAYRWCVRNNIAIAPQAKAANDWYITISNKGITNRSPESYGKNLIWEKIFEYCKYYYEKNK